MDLERLKRISNLEDRKVAREIFYNIHEKVAYKNLSLYTTLEKEIYDEMKDPLEKFYISTAMEYKYNLNANDEFMKPMLEENNSIFLDCDLMKFTKLLSMDKVYDGFIKTSRKTYNIKAKISQSLKYINQIEKIYKVFTFNNLEWHTINSPHIYNFVDLIFDDLTLDEDDEILEIDVDLGEYNKYKKPNLIPLWNVSHLTIEDETFSFDVGGGKYEHLFEISDTNGYLIDIDNDRCISFKHQNNKISILSDYDKLLSWNVFRVNKRNSENSYSYGVYSNNRNLQFLSRYIIFNKSINPTKAEIIRIINLYELSKIFEFLEVKILDNYDKLIKTHNFNIFVEDDIRVENYKKIMVVVFRNKSNTNFLEYEKISFFVSEIQFYFPEYKCIGELL